MPARTTIGCSRKKHISVHELMTICEDYYNLFKLKKNEASSPWRRFYWGGGSTLIECPACSKPYRGNASDMLDLCNHIKRCHKESQDLLLLCVCKDYSETLEYMKNKIKKHAVFWYKKRLRCKPLPLKNSWAQRCWSPIQQKVTMLTWLLGRSLALVCWNPCLVVHFQAFLLVLYHPPPPTWW